MDVLLAQAGVTRVHAVTRMDWLGLPVHAAVRPNARSVTVEFGADLRRDEEAAARASWRASARFAAEYSTRALRLETPAQLRREGRSVLDCSRLPPALHSTYSETRPMAWVTSRDLVTAKELEVPFELVHAADLSPPLFGQRCFGPIGSGLAAAASTAEATVDAFHEAVAAEAALAAMALDPSMAQRRTIAVSRVLDDVVHELVACIERSGGALQLWDVTERPGTVAVASSVVRRTEPHRSLRNAAPVAVGSGDDHRSAAIAALLRLACARMATVTGRGEITGAAGAWTLPARRRARTAAAPHRSAVRAVRVLGPPTTTGPRPSLPEQRLAMALERMGMKDAGQILAVDLDGSGGASVRVLLLPQPARRRNGGR